MAILNETSRFQLKTETTMSAQFKFKTVTLLIFFIFIFWGSFAVDLTLHPDKERIPLHRAFILLTAIIFLANFRQALSICLKNKALVFLIFYVLLSAAWATNSTGVVKNVIFLASIMFISMLTALAFNDNRIALMRRLFWLFFLMTLGSIFTALYYPNIGIHTPLYSKARWRGITEHPNHLGMQALTLIWLSANLFFIAKSKFEKLLRFLAIIAAEYAILKADSMTSFLTSIIIMAYVSYLYLFGRLRMSIQITFAILAGLVCLSVFTFYMSASELTTVTLQSTGRNTTFTGRSLLWKNALDAVADNLIFGYGFDDLEQLTKKYHIQMSHLHNGYIEILVKGGMIASLLVIFIFLKTIFRQLRTRSIDKEYFAFLNTGIIMVLIHNVTESSLLHGISTFSIMSIFIFISTSLIDKNDTLSTSPS